jgi:hypothetical protein
VGGQVVGTWKLVSWRRIAQDGSVTYPLGEGATGVLVYAPDGTMAVQMTAANRPSLPTADPIGGTTQQRADAYSTCLAYAGTWEVQGDSVVHRLDVSLFPNWAGTTQSRPFTNDGTTLVLRTPPTESADGTMVNELSWARAV